MKVRLTVKKRVIFEGRQYHPGQEYILPWYVAEQIEHNFGETHGARVGAEAEKEDAGPTLPEAIEQEVKTRRVRRKKAESEEEAEDA